MKLADSLILPPSGHFLLKVFRRGVLVDLVDEKNLIVDGSKQVHAKLLGGAVANQSVSMSRLLARATMHQRRKMLNAS